MVGVSLVILGGLIICTWEGYLVGSSLGLPHEPPLGMDLGNTLGSLIEYPNPVAELGSLEEYLSGMILGNPTRSLPVSSVGMSPRLLLVNCTESLICIFSGTILDSPLGLRFICDANRYW